MKNNNFLKQISKVSLIFFLVVAIIFAIVSYIDYSLLIGWILGSIIAFLGFLARILFNKNFFKKKKSKKTAFIFVFIYYIFFFVLQVVSIILIILINSYVNSITFFVEKNLVLALKPINLFTYIFGVNLIMINTIITNFLYLKKNKKIGGLFVRII